MNTIEKEKLVHDIIEELIVKSKDKAAVTCWGEPALLLCDVINIINNMAETDYKRYWAYDCTVKYDECSPKNEHPLCSMCEHHWKRQKDLKGCIGVKVAEGLEPSEKPCEKYECVLGKHLK